MFDLSSDLLQVILTNGVPIFGLLLFLGAMGFPVPTTLLVIASGAFVRQGTLELNSALIGLCCVIVGDSLSFGIGRLGNGRLERRFKSNRRWQSAMNTFRSRGGLAIYLTRWLFTSIAIPTNLLAGGSGYRYDRFLFMTMLGEITWIGLFGGLGYALGGQWEILSKYLPDMASLAFGIAAIVAYVYWRVEKNQQMNQTGSSKTNFANPAA
jgi:membrane protein DedA with SNARE-associated domain